MFSAGRHLIELYIPRTHQPWDSRLEPIDSDMDKIQCWERCLVRDDAKIAPKRAVQMHVMQMRTLHPALSIGPCAVETLQAPVEIPFSGMSMSEPSSFKSIQSFGSFFKHWWSTHWRSVLVLFFGIYLPLQIFLILALQVWRLGAGGLSWDVSILLAIHATMQERLDVLALTLTKFGTRWGVFPAAIALMLMLLFLKQWRSLTYLLITLPGGVLINRIGKEFMHRARPHLWESTFPPEPEFAFPSGHAMSSMTFVAALVILTWGSRWCWLVATLGGLFVVAIGWTRLYLGVHYPSDIFAGWMMALAWVVGVNWALNLRPNKPTTVVEEKAVEEAIRANAQADANAQE